MTPLNVRINDMNSKCRSQLVVSVLTYGGREIDITFDL